MSARTWHLDRLAAALAVAGWPVATRYEQDPPQLRVRHPDSPVFGASVGVAACADQRLWFHTAGHRLLAPVGRPGAAAAQLMALLGPSGLTAAACAGRPMGRGA